MSDEFPNVYPYSCEEARSQNQLSLWRESHRENIACKNAIEEAIRRNFDGMHLESDCAQNVINQYGFNRVQWVLANTVQQKDWDGRFSRDNKAWAKSVFIPPDKNRLTDHNLEYVVESHPAVLDGFVNQYRRAYQAQELSGPAQCEPQQSGGMGGMKLE
ncbi:hypothetical protein OBV_42830 [Oscillibacter valericigenes Sjm18-20]|nr:hypothetical protein OBV_42830 [Oscillibacter valericigenes Sjm18-20]